MRKININLFCKKSLFFLTIVFLIVLIPSILIKENQNLLRLTYFDELFARKDRFEKFVKSSKSINLVSGSSHAKDFFDVNAFGKRWFTYANGAQYLELSMIQLESIVAQNIKIDTLLMTMDMFDLAPLPPEVNFNYALYRGIFNKSSITDILSFYFKKPVDAFSGDIKLLKRVIRNMVNRSKHLGDNRIARMQDNGFLPKDDTPFYDARKKIEFENLDNEQTFSYFANFVKENNIKLILVATPKSASYFNAIDKEDLKYWNEFKLKFEKSYPWVRVFDFENYRPVDSLFVDLDHPQSILRKQFSDTLKSILSDTK